MTACSNGSLKRRAKESLSRSGNNHRKTLLIHTGVTLAVSIVLLLLDYLLSKSIDEKPGLSGLDSRTMLRTVQQALLIVNVLFMPFWEQGIRYWSLKASREQPAGRQDLTEGFRRFWPLFRLTILRMLMLFALSFAVSYIASAIFALTPAATPLMEAMEQMLTESGSLTDMQSLMLSLPEDVVTSVATTMMLIMGILLLITYVPLMYMFRLADYFVFDTPGIRARQALRLSFRAVRKDFWRLLKLDLSFWWYYLPVAALTVVANLDMILSGAGVALPVSPETAYFGCSLLYAVGTLVLYTAARGPVEVCYARAYDYMKN